MIVHKGDCRFGLLAVARVSAIALLGLSVANCSGPTARGGKSLDSKYGVAASPKVIPDGEPIPKGGGRAMVGKPYVVGGRTYVPTTGKGFDREGWASWYGTAFHGRLTANGEVFDRESVAAASPTLPLPSYVRVTNVVNKRSMVVRVNDRGPYERDRLIDLSERAAVALDFHRKGTTRVRVEYLGKASVDGSDDAKLLATLRTDGQPASFGKTRGTMFADLGGTAAPSSPPASSASPVARAAPIRLADAGPDAEIVLPRPKMVERVTANAESEPVSHVAISASRSVEDSEDEVAEAPVPPARPAGEGTVAAIPGAAPLRGQLTPGPVATLPPHRPVLAGIY